MPVPTSIDDLSTTAASNSPSGSETPTEGDNYIRTLSAFIASLRNRTDGTTSVTGIKLANTGVADTATLDWYEEGTFTPTLRFGGGTTGITYSTQAGSFTRIGNRVSFLLRIVLTSKGSSTGGATIAGLPYNQSTTSQPYSTYYSSMSGLTGVVVGIATASGGTTVTLVQTNSTGATAIGDTEFSNTSTVIVTGSYSV